MKIMMQRTTLVALEAKAHHLQQRTVCNGAEANLKHKIKKSGYHFHNKKWFLKIQFSRFYLKDFLFFNYESLFITK